MNRSSRIRPEQFIFILIMVTLLPLLISCGNFPVASPGEMNNESGSAPSTTTLTPFQPVTDTQTVIPSTVETGLQTMTSHTETPTPEPSPLPADPSQSVWLAPYLPPGIKEQISLPGGINIVNDPSNAAAHLSVGDEATLTTWLYALVAPYPTITDQVLKRDLLQSWQGNPPGPFSGQPLFLDQHTLDVLSAWWGEPAPSAVQVIPTRELLEKAWDQRPSWGIIPFETLEPGWKVLAVENQSPLRRNFDPGDYALSIPFSFLGDSEIIEQVLLNSNLPASNRDPDLLTTVAVTGVTALVRATAFTMHRNGITYPAQDIGEILRSADITHISNEIPFTVDCPFPNPVQESLRFCSRPEYIELLEEVGTDIVELTGDHFGDWGPGAMRYTLEMYEDRDWDYYGGGYDRKDARKARVIEHNGNHIAFIGCNGKGGGYATASDNQPGAVACDFNWLKEEISRLTSEGNQVIATFQHFEYYTYFPQPDQQRDFRALAEAGAAVVSGSQAHQPQGLEFHKNAFIHYGLGNLFFDQYHFCTDYACDDGFIDMHFFYDGEYLGNELLTIVFEDYARPRLMTPEERGILLNKVFSASGWQ